MPKDFEPFYMTMYGGDPLNHPIDGMLGNYFLYGYRDWKYTGEEMTGMRMGTFIWVPVGYRKSLRAVYKEAFKLALQRGFSPSLPHGQWREEIARTYKNHSFPRGIGDPSWRKRRRIFIPYISMFDLPDFVLAHGHYDHTWRWLVQISIGFLRI